MSKPIVLAAVGVRLISSEIVVWHVHPFNFCRREDAGGKAGLLLLTITTHNKKQTEYEKKQQLEPSSYLSPHPFSKEELATVL